MFGKQKTKLNIAYPHTRGTFARKWATVVFVCAYVITSIIGGFVYQVTPAEAAIPKLINFQGKLTAVSNGSNVANGTYAFEFKLYNDPTAGSLLWTETYDQVAGACAKLTVTNGVFNAKLGSCASLASIDFTGGALYLTVNFAPTGTSYDGEMAPRKQLVSSAYAFVANSVSGDGVVNNAVQSATALSTGRTGANPALQVDTNTSSSVTGLKVTAAAAAGGIALAAISSGIDENLTLDAKGAGTLSFGASSTGNILLGGGSASTGCTVTNTTGAFACTAGGSFTTMALTGAVTGATSYNGLVVTANTGVITSGTWNGTAVVDTYVADTLTVDSSSSVHWNALNNYPAACSAGSAISALADTTNTCTSFNTDTSITLQDAYDATSGNTITTTSARNIALTFAANTSITLDAATTDTTQTNGVIDLDVDSLTNTASAIDINFEGTGTTSSATQNGLNLTMVPSNATNARTYNGIKITNPDAGSVANTIVGLNVDVTTANGSDTTYSALFNGGFVGIGNSAPTQALEVTGSVIAGQSLSFGKGLTNTSLGFGFGRNFNTGGMFDSGRYGFQFTRPGNADRLDIEVYDGAGTFIGYGPRVDSLGTLNLGLISVTGAATTNALNLSQTWNTSGAPTAFKINITNTASNAAALLQDWQVGGSSKMAIRVDGNVGIGDSSPTALLTVGSGDLFQVNSSGAIAAVVGITNTGAENTTVSSATALTVAKTGSNYALQVDTATATAVTGLKITSAAAAGGVALAAISSGTDENLTIDAKGAGTISLGASSTGNVLLAGGSGSTGCTVTNATGAFTCTAGASFTTGAFTGAITGATGYNGLVITANTGVITTGTWNGTAIGSQYGGTGQNFSASSGVPSINAGTWQANAITQNGVLYGGASNALSFTAVGTTGQCLVGNTAAAPTWSSCAGLVTLQAAYGAGNTIETASNNPVIITETTTGAVTGDLLQLTVNQATGGTYAGDAVQITMDGFDANAYTGNGINIIIDQSQNTGSPILVQDDAATTLFQLSENGAITLGAASAETTAITITDTDYTNALSIGDNNIIGTTSAIDFTNFDVSSAGAIVGVGLNSGTGLIQGTGGLTVTGTTSINFNTNSATDINTGTSNTLVTIGGGSGTFSLQTTNIDISNTGAITNSTGYNGLVVTANTGVVTTGTWNGTAIGSQYGGTGQNFSASSGLPSINSGTWQANAITQNGVAYGGASNAMSFTAQGAANTVLVANAGAPSFSAAITVGTSVTSPTINASTVLQQGGVSINTAGTLSNVAYLNQANAFTAAQGITIQSATALNVARAGTNYAFQVDTNTASSATGVKITAAAAAGGVAIAAISSGTDENITFDAKGAGTISLGASSTGDILLGGGSGSTGCTVTNATGAFACTAAITGSNLSGTNTGDVTLAAIGAVPNANGASLSGQVLNLQPASASFGGVVTTGAQTFTGEKTFSGTGGTNVIITNSAATNTNGVLNLTATSSTSDFVPSIYSSRTVTGTGSLTAVYGIENYVSSTAVVAGASVGQTLYGDYNVVSKSGADTATGTYTSYGSYNSASNTGRTNAGTVNTYGGYFSGVGDTAGTSTAYGLHVQASGADNNYAIVTNGGNVGIGDLSPASLFTVGSGDLFQINSSGQIGVQQAPVSDYLFALAGTTGNDNSRIIDITQANNAAENSLVISIANTANTGSYSDSSIAIKNLSSSITPTSSFFSSAGAASLSLYGDEQNITTSSITMGDTLSNEVSLLVFGQSSSITLSPTINDTVGNSLITANAYGVYSKITSSSPTYTNTNGGANIDTYAGYFDNLGSSTGDANTTYNSYGIYARSGASLSTTGQTTHYGGYLEASTAANTNYGIYITSSGATTNYALYSALGINFMADDVYVGALTETLSNTGFAMNGNDVFIEDKLGVEGSIYSDTSLIVGASTTYANGSISQSSGETLSIGTTSAALTLQTTTSGDINISPAGNVLLAGGSGSTGCTVTGTTGALACTSTIATGVAGGTIGGLLVSGNTSGTVSILPQAAAGTYNFNLPTTAGSSGHVLTSAGGGASAMTWTDPSGLGVRWNALIAPTGNLSLAHGASTTAFTFNSITSGSAFGLSSTSLTSGNLLQATGSGATMTTGGELVDLALGANTVGAGLTVTSTGTYTGVGAADGLINVTANGLTSGYAFQIPHTTSVVSGSLMRLSSTSVDTSTIGSLLSLSSTASTAGTIAMITNNTASFTGTSFSVSNTGITSGAGIRVTGGSGMTTGGELVDLVLGANTVGAGLSVTSTGTYTGVGAADGLVNITANGLTSGYAFQIPHTTSVISTTGSLMRLSSTSVDTGTAGTLLSLASTGSTAGTIAMITNNTASFTGTSFSVSNTGQTTGTGLLVTGGGANLNASGELIDLAMGAATVGSGINVTTTGVYTGAGIVQLTANSATTGVIQAVSTTGLTTGSAIRVTGSGATMQTGGELIDLVLGANTVGAGLTITGTGAYTGTGAADGFLNIVGNSLTTGHGSKMSYTAITSGTGLLITGGSALTTNGELIDLNMSTSAGGQGINITNTGTYTGTGLIVMTANSATTGTILNQSATALTTGRAQSITLGTALTTGGLLSTTGASYLHTGSETGSLVSLAYTDASSNAAGAAVTNGILLSPTINTTASAGSKTINGISIAPTHTACGTTAGTCAYNGITQTTAAVTQTTTNALTITGNNIATAGALVQNTAAGSITWVGQNIQMPNITQTTGTVTSTGLKITGGTVTSGTAYALTTSSTAGNVGIGTTTPGSLLEVNGTAGFGFENLELNGGFESGSFTSAYSDLADGGSGTLTVTSGGGWEGTYFVRNSAQVGGHAFRLRPTFVIPTSTASLSYYGRRNGVANSWGSSPANGVVTPITVYLYDETSATTVCNTGSNSPGTNWTRYNVSCSVTAGHTFSVQVMMDGWSGQYNADIDAVQVEAGLAVMEYGAPLKLSTNGGGYIMGNVGIGTGTVDKKLHIAETVTGIAYSLKLDNYHSSTDDATGILFSVQGDGSHNFLSGRGKGGLVYAMPSGATWNRGDFYFLQDATADNSNPTLADASMVIKNSGDIGIGEVNPTTAKLVINQTDAANLPGIYINSEESTTTQSVFSIESDTATGSGADTVKFKITADGSVYSDANVYGTPADVAEMYNISGPVTAGDVVEIVAMTGRLDGEKFGVKRHEPTSNAPVLGVISTAPGTTLGYEWKRPDILAQQKPVALVGRVPIKVTNENGAIMPGDFLVASATQAGYAMKATKAGPVIGQALDKLTGTTGSITAFIKPTNYNGVNIEDKIAGGLDFDYGDEDQTAQTSEQMLEHLIAQLDELDYDNLSQINTDLVIAGAEVVSPNVTTQTLRTDFLSSATADGSLTVASATIMNGGLIVDEIGSVGGLLSMMSDVEFFGTPYFTVDTAGFAVIKAGVQSVDVTFSREYLAQPIVNASVSFEQDVDQSVLDEEAREVLKADAIAAAQTFLAEGVSYVITNKSKFGFTIVLSKPAPTDVKMSWTALAVRNASTFMSLDTPEGFVAGAGDPGDGVGDTPPGDGSGDGSGDGGTPPPGDGSGGETPPPSDPPPSDPPSGDGSGDGGIGG